MKKQLFILMLVFGVFTTQAQKSTNEAAYNLADMIEAALEHNKALKNQQLELKRMGLTQKQIYHTYIPTLELAGRYAYSKGQLNVDTEPVPFSTPEFTLPIQIPGLPPLTVPPMNLAVPGINQELDFSGNLWMGGLTAKWTLFTGLKVPYLGKAVKHKMRAAEYLLEQSEADLIAEVSGYFDRVALIMQAERVLSESERRLDREAQVAQKALSEGLITQHDYQKIEIARLDLSSRQIELRGKKQLLHLKLHQLTGLPLDSLIGLKVELSPFEGALGSGSYLERPEIKALDEAVLASEYKLKSESSGYLPKVQAFAAHQYAGFTNGEVGPLAFNEMSAYPLNMVGVGFKWELFDGLHTRHERQKAKISIQQTENKRAEAAEMLMLNYNNALNNYQVTTAQEVLRAKQKEVSRRSMDISYREYQNGLIKVSEFLEAQADYEKSVLDYYQTVYTQRQSAIQLLNASGQLNLSTLRALGK